MKIAIHPLLSLKAVGSDDNKHTDSLYTPTAHNGIQTSLFIEFHSQVPAFGALELRHYSEKIVNFSNINILVGFRGPSFIRVMQHQALFFFTSCWLSFRHKD